MRKKEKAQPNHFKVIALDDEKGIIDTLNQILPKNGYYFQGFIDASLALKELCTNKYDILIIDYYMINLTAKDFIDKLRNTKTFNRGIYTILLTGHVDLAPPIETMRNLDIQDYCVKSSRFEELLLRMETAKKAIEFKRPKIPEYFPDRLKYFREKKGLNQIEVGEYLGVGRSAISNYESGANEPDRDKLIKLSILFDISLDYLMGKY